MNVFVDAVVYGDDAFASWPSLPPTTGHHAADAVGVVNDAVEFTLYLSPHILTNVERVLLTPVGQDGFGWDPDAVEDYLDVLVSIANNGANVLTPTQPVDDCPDFEDNRILELALASGALLIVANDTDLLSMSPWRGRPIVTPQDFVARADGMRRAVRRSRRNTPEK